MVDSFQAFEFSLDHFKCKYKQFPKEFMLGTGSSAYQIEGAWKDEGKSESICDRIAHTQQELFANYSNSENSILKNASTEISSAIITGDIACNSYYKMDEDINLLKELGVQFYRFSLSWTRILPKGEESSVNLAGVQYYNRLIDKLLENNITPIVTIYHWDLPQSIQDLGGWYNKYVIEFFTRYVRFVFSTFGDRVKYWITINEPHIICYGHKNVGAFALTVNDFGYYVAIHHLILAHASAYHLYNQEFIKSQKGEIGISLSMEWHYPKNVDSQEDHHAADRARMWQFEIFSHPLFFGDYPQELKQRVELINQSKGITISRLLHFSENEKSLIKGTLDFLGINHYFSCYATTELPTNNELPLRSLDLNVKLSLVDELPHSNPMWIKKTPKGMRNVLCWIKDTYGNPKVLITENGVSCIEQNEDDNKFKKIRYHYGYLSAVLKAIYKDGCNVIGYGVWSFLDSFEWLSGYKPKFGIYKVNFDDPNRSRSPKKSLQFFQQLFQTKSLPDVLDDLYCNN